LAVSSFLAGHLHHDAQKRFDDGAIVEPRRGTTFGGCRNQTTSHRMPRLNMAAASKVRETSSDFLSEMMSDRNAIIFDGCCMNGEMGLRRPPFAAIIV